MRGPTRVRMPQVFPARRRFYGRGPRPRLSVVVPVYDVERFVDDCLISLRGQSYTDFEAVVVVDGSTDGSSAIVERHARADRRIRVLHQPNLGLSAARNNGVQAARGDFLTFLDSDDTLPPDAYALMMSTIERTGSDLVVGTLKRVTDRRQQTMRLMERNHRVRRERVSLMEMPLILADVFATNKVYRRTFWETAGVTFPDRLRYEDQPALTKAFLACHRFDVIPETVYLWRVRADQSSLTQGRHELEDLVDRVRSKRMSTALVRQSASDELLDAWFRDILPVDMWEYFRAVPRASEDYWATLCAAVREFWNDDSVPFDHTRLPVQQRLMGWLAGHGRRRELEELIDFIDHHGGDIPVEIRDDHVVAHLPGASDPTDLPTSVVVLGDHEQRWECRLTSAAWHGNLLQVEGFALIRNVPTHEVSTELDGTLVSVEEPCSTKELRVEQVTEPHATRFAGRERQNFDSCGFTTTIDLQDLREARPEGGAWRFQLRRRVEGISASGGIAQDDGAPVDQGWHELVDAGGCFARARLTEHDGELVVEIRGA